MTDDFHTRTVNRTQIDARIDEAYRLRAETYAMLGRGAWQAVARLFGAR